jgi:hypothetical protein
VVFIREKLDKVEKEFIKAKVNLSFREIKVMNHVKKYTSLEVREHHLHSS